MSEISILNGYKIKDKKAVRYYDTISNMKSDTTLKAGMYVKTKGYYSVNDGGNSTYIIVEDTNDNLVDDGGLVHELNNGLFALLLLNDTITPEMFGAVGDGVTDDTIPLTKCIAQNKIINLSKNYLTSAKIRIGDNENITINGEKSTIKYTGNDFAFLIQGINGANIHFGKIESTNGGCIELYSANGTTDRVQYLNLHFNHLRASDSSKVIYAHVENNGWLNEINLYGGYMTKGLYGIYIDNQSNGTGGTGAWKYINIGFEGTTTNVYINASTGNKIRGHYFENVRYVENTTSTMLETHGQVERLRFISWGGLEESRLNLEVTKLKYVEFICPIYENGTVNVIGTGLYYNNGIKKYYHEDIERNVLSSHINTNVATSGTAVLFREGNICILNISDLVLTSTSGDILEQGVNSKLPVAITNGVLTTTSGESARVYIRTNGSVAIQAPQAGTYYGQLTYITDDYIS